MKDDIFHFLRFGKTYQLRIKTARDLERVLKLDDALWVATSAPSSAFRCDPKLLSLIDKDGSGRITSDEIKAAIRWVLERLADKEFLLKETDQLPLAALQSDSTDANALTGSAKYVLTALDQGGTDSVSLGQVRQFLANLQKQPLNGDGIIAPGATQDPQLIELIKDAIKATGGIEDASGSIGIDIMKMEEFVAAARAYLEWKKGLDLLDGEMISDRMPAGEDTPELYRIFNEHAGRVDEFFNQCKALRFDPEVVANTQKAKLAATVENNEKQKLEWELSRRPLATLTGDARLPLSKENVNPLFAEWITWLGDKVLKRILGTVQDTLEEKDWKKVKAALKPYGDHLASKKGISAAEIPIARLTAYTRKDLVDKVKDLIEQDRKVAYIREGVCQLEQLLLYTRYILRLANNFVSFSQLYAVHERALFEMGSAVLDGRWFSLALKVEDVAKHEQVAKMSNIFTLYLEVTGKNKGKDEKFTVAVPATYGSKGNLCVDKRGIFFDTEGKEFDARVIKIIENPISIREALISPLVRLRDFVVGKIESISGSSEQELTKNADALFKAPAPEAGKPAAGAMGGSSGMLLGLGVGAAALGSAFAYITKTVVSMSLNQRIFGLIGAIAVVFVPISLVAIMKLRKQDLSALLEAGGWAINARMRPNRAQRRMFTRHAPYPKDATGVPRDYWLHTLVKALIIAALLTGGYFLYKEITSRKRDRRSAPLTSPAVVVPAPAAPAPVSTNAAPKTAS